MKACRRESGCQALGFLTRVDKLLVHNHSMSLERFNIESVQTLGCRNAPLAKGLPFFYMIKRCLTPFAF